MLGNNTQEKMQVSSDCGETEPKTTMYEKSDLLRMIKEPLEFQYQRIIAKIMEAIQWTNGDIVLCFSGGKDSALILDMYCEFAVMLNKQHLPIRVVWANTTNETISMKNYVPWFIKRCEKKYGVHIEMDEVKPCNGNNIVTVMKREGLPFVSKMVSSIVRKVTRSMEENRVTYDDIKDLHHSTLYCRDTLREMGLNDTTILALTGWSCRKNSFGTEFVLPQQWMPLLGIKELSGYNLHLSEKCCYYLKKEPAGRLNYKNIMTGEQAVESKTRESTWLKHGCNYRFPDKSVKSTPLGSVSLDAVLYAIHYRKIPLCPDYGEVVYCDQKRCYQCTNAQRTGCALCGFGIKFDPDRFIRLQKTDPAKIAFAFKPIDKGGLGYREMCQFLNTYCKTKIKIPEL